MLVEGSPQTYSLASPTYCLTTLKNHPCPQSQGARRESGGCMKERETLCPLSRSCLTPKQATPGCELILEDV